MNNLLLLLQTVIPHPIRTILRPIIRVFRVVKFLVNYKFLPPPAGTDLAGYERLIRFIETHNLLTIDGDIVEIGAFLGGGTYKLAKYLELKRSTKKVYAIDIFDIYADRTICIQGVSMAELYKQAVNKFGRDLSPWDIFQRVTRKCKNVVVIRGDSKEVVLPIHQICFAFIDGNHDPSYVRNDFYLVWSKLSVGGVVAFDDYGYDLPQVTAIINLIVGENAHQITILHRDGKIIFLQKLKLVNS